MYAEAETDTVAPPSLTRTRRDLIWRIALVAPAVVLAMTTLTALSARYVSVRTTALVPTFPVGDWILADFGSNLAIGAVLSVAALAIGTAVWAFTEARWAAGLTAGASLTLMGWALLVLGVMERPIRLVHDALAAPTSAPGSPDAFVITVERTAGFGLLLAVAVLSLLTAAACLPHLRRDPFPSLNPWVAACGAAAMLGVAVGPLLPIGSAALGDNFTTASDRPGLFLIGRGVHLLVLAGCGIGGFLLVRTAGLGMVLGAVPLLVWMTLSALLEWGSAPIGVGVANPGRFPTSQDPGRMIGSDVHAMTALSTAALALLTAVALSMAMAHGRAGDRSHRTPHEESH